MAHSPTDRLLQFQRWLVATGVLAAGLAVVVVLQALRAESGGGQSAPHDDAWKAQQVGSMVAHTSGIFDSFPDADVGRVLLPGLEGRENEKTHVSSNRFGMREREYEIPKPEDVIRVVFLGDSFVFGWQLEVEQRASALLEHELVSRRQAGDQRIEVLSLGITSWNLGASSAYLRRQLDVLAPDVVVHVVVPNDVYDNWGVRGFGGIASISLPHRERADSLLFDGHGSSTFGSSFTSVLPHGLDYEGRSRYAQMNADAIELARAVEAAGGHYFLLVNFGPLISRAESLLVPGLPDDSLIWLPAEFLVSPKFTLSATDPHWNPDGQALVARLVYGFVQQLGLLPQLGLPPWDEASRAMEELHAVGKQQARWPVDMAVLLGGRTMVSELDFESGRVASGFQVHGGIDAQGRVSPYASLVLLNAGARSLHVVGSGLDRTLREGTTLAISIEGRAVHRLVLQRAQPFDLALDLPDDLRELPMLNVRFEVDDHVYAPEDLRHCIGAKLSRVALEP